MRTRLLSSMLAVLALALPLAAEAQSGAATRYVHGRHDRVSEIMRRAVTTDAQRTARDTEVNGIIGDLLDYDALARGALGAHWAEHSAAEQQEFVALLRQLIERQYRNSLEHILEFDVTYGTETAAPEGAVVHTSARSHTDRRAPSVAIDYTVHQVGEAWRVVDVNTDGVGMVRNYQQQFNRIITQHGWDGLLTRMRERLAAPATAATGTH